MPRQKDGTKPIATRASYQISRLGCRTCKVRRIRCDKTRPRCRNCVSTGRSCDGVGAHNFVFVGIGPGGRKQHGQIRNSPPTLALTPPRRQDELRSFNVFFTKAAPLFSTGHLDAAFWKDLVPRISQSMPFAWSSAIAIGLIFENPIYGVDSGRFLAPQLRPPQLQALQWYARAISQLSQHMDNSTGAGLVALLSCVLFVSCECQHGNEPSGFSLLEHGWSLLSAYISPEGLSRSGSPVTDALEQALIPFASRQALILAQLGLPLPAYAIDVPSAFSARHHRTLLPSLHPIIDIDVLRRELYSLLYRSYEVIRAGVLVLDQPSEVPRIAEVRDRILDLLRQWHKKLNEYTRSSSLSMKELVTTAYHLAYFHTTHVLLSTCLSSTETALDVHLNSFSQIVNHACTILSTPHQPPANPFISGIAPPLYFTATRCRHPIFRRRALSLLKLAPPPVQPNIWTALPTLEIAERVIAFEESSRPLPIDLASSSNCRNGGGNNDDNLLPLDVLVPEATRVHHIQVITRPRSPSLGAGGNRARELALRFITYTEKRELKEHVIDLPPEQKGGYCRVTESESLGGILSSLM